jgi:hypothetical protein
VKAWLRRKREIRRLRHEECRARVRFFRAYYAYQDIAVVLGRTPGAWGPLGAVSQAQDESVAASEELKRIQVALRRAEQTGRTA